MGKEPYPEDPAAPFIDRLVYGTPRNGAINAVRKLLEKGPPGQDPKPADIARHRWFLSLSEDDQAKVLEVARKAVDQALFSVMVLLDGATGGWPVQGLYSDFALYLQAYEDKESLRADRPAYRSRINDPETPPDLHHKFMRAVMEADEESDSDPQG